MGIHVDEVWLKMAARSLLCKVGKIPFTYLGLPIGSATNRMETWAPIIDRIERKLATWKSKTLSIAGRLTLIKASISSLPIYFMSLFPIPKGIIKKINALQRRFLWGGGEKNRPLALVAWDIILELPKIIGGLGCGNILHRNLALLLKWVWRFLIEPNALWRKVVCAKYNYSPLFQAHDLQIPPSNLGRGREFMPSCLAITSPMIYLKLILKEGWGMGEWPSSGMTNGLGPSL